jgi:hypothetical protein
MKTYPILFTAPMVRALLEGRKTQTRRIIKPQPRTGCLYQYSEGAATHVAAYLPHPPVRVRIENESCATRCPGGQPGDLLWVRETWAARPDYDDLPTSECGNEGIWWRASQTAWPQGYETCHGKWRPSIHMPRWASRLTLELVEVRAERLQDITHADAMAEGVSHSIDLRPMATLSGEEFAATHSKAVNEAARKAYKELWDLINGNGAWNENPWVWALAFKVHHCNIDNFLKQKTS